MSGAQPHPSDYGLAMTDRLKQMRPRGAMTGVDLGSPKRRTPSQTARKADDMDLTIGRRLRERRMLLGLSQDELAQRIGLSFQQLQKYETGENRISAARLYRIAQVLDVSITWFFAAAPARGN